MKVLSFNIDKDSVDSIVYKINTYFPFHKVELLTDNNTLSAVIYELPHHKPMPLTSTNPGEEMLVFIPLGYSVKHVSSVKINGSTADYFKVNGGLFVKAVLSGILNVEIVSKDNTIFYPIKVSSIWNTDSSTNTWTNPTTATESIAYPFSAGPIKIEPKQNYKNLPENTEVLAIIKDRVIYRKLGLVEKPVIVSGSYSNPTTHSIELEFDIIGTVYIDGKEVPDTYISGNTIDLSSWASAENIRGIEGGIHQVVSVGSYTTYGTYMLNYIPVDNNDNDKVKVSSNDTTEGYLIDKITAGAGIQLAELNDGGDEDLEISTKLEVVEMTISSGDGAVPVPLSANGKTLVVYTTTTSTSDYLELPDLSTVPDGWRCWIVRRPDSGSGTLILKQKSGNTINSFGYVLLRIAQPSPGCGYGVGRSPEGWFVAKHTSTDWFVQQIGQFWHNYDGCFNIQSWGDTGIYMRSQNNQDTYFQVQGAGKRGQLRWTSGYNTYIEPNPQFGDCGVKIERMAATGGTYGMHLAVGDVAPGGSGGYRVFVIGNGTAPSAAPSSGAQMWAESGVLKVQPQDGNTFSLGGGGFTYPGTARIDGNVGLNTPPHVNWRLSVQSKFPLQLKDSSGVPVIEHYADDRHIRLHNGYKIYGRHQNLELGTWDTTQLIGLIIDQTTADITIPYNLTVSGTLTNTEVQDNTTHRTTTGNPHDTALDDLTDVDAPSPSDGEVLTWDGATGKWVSASGGGGVTDHGALTGLGDDDHTQYSLVSGARAFTGPVGGVDPTDATHLTTKNYVDNGLAGKADTIHTHTASDVTDFDTEVSNNTDVAANTAHRSRTDNPHNVTASQVGLNSTDDLIEGSTNLYYTDARVSANSDVAANTAHRNTTGNPHDTTYGDIPLEVVEMTISSGDGAVPVPLSANGKMLVVYATTYSDSDYLELPDLSTVPDGWYCRIVRRPDSPGLLSLQQKSGNTINSETDNKIDIVSNHVTGFNGARGAEGLFIAKHTSTDWFVQQIGQFHHNKNGVFNIQSWGNTGIYMRSRNNQDTYIQTGGSATRGQLRWHGYNTYIEPNAQFGDVGVKIDRMTATGGTHGVHLAVGDVAPGGSGGYRVFVIGNGTAPSASPSSGAQMWAESGVLKVQPQDGNTLSVGDGSLVYPADAEFDGYVGIGRAPNHGGWRLAAQGRWVMQLSDTSGIPVLEAHGDGRVVNLMNNTVLGGYYQDLEFRVYDGYSRQGLIIDQSTGDVSIPHNLTVSGTLTNTEVQDNTTHRTTTGNPHNTALNDITDVNLSTLSDGEILEWNASSSKWVNKTHVHTASDISDFDTEVSNNTSVTANTAHRSRTDNPHGVTAAQVGINSTDDISEGSFNLYYTDTRVSANTDVSANSAHRTSTGNPHGTDITDLPSVNAPTPNDGDILVWDTSTSKWISMAHTHTASDISDFDTEVSNNTDVAANTVHRGRTDNPHNVTASQVGINSTDDIAEGSTNLYYTEARVSANADVSANSTHRVATGNPHNTALDDITDVNAPSPADGEVLTWDDATGKWISAGTGVVTDHGLLTGLSDDDHEQYSLVDGTRAFTGPVGGVDPTDASHLSTKSYVDAGLAGKADTVHTHTASDVTDFDTEVSNNSDVSANTTHRSRTDNPHNVTASQVGLNSTDDLDEGSSNLYYTDERVSSNTDVAANTAHRNTTGNPHDTTYGDILLETKEIAIFGGTGVVPLSAEDGGKQIFVYTSATASSDYVELPSLSDVENGWRCVIFRKLESPTYGRVFLKPASGEKINNITDLTTVKWVPTPGTSQDSTGFATDRNSYGWFVWKMNENSWGLTDIVSSGGYNNCFNHYGLGDTGIYIRSLGNNKTYISAQGAGLRGAIEWTSGYDIHLLPNAQYWDCGVKVDRMPGGTYGTHLAIGNVAPGGSGGYRVFVIGNGTAPSAAPSSGAQMWAESGVLKVQPQDGNTLSVGGGSLVYPADAQITGKVGIGKAPDNNWQLSVQSKFAFQLKDSSGIPVLEQYADYRNLYLLNNNKIQGYLQDLELDVYDGSSVHQGLVIDETTGNVSIPHDLLVSGTLTNAEVQANTSARHSHSNKTVLDAITDAGSGSIITNAERSDITDNTTHRGRTDNPHNVTASQVGLNSTDDLAEGTTNLYYTDSRVSANSDVSANTTHRNTTGNPHSTALNDITDVNLSTLSDEEILVWDSSTSKWVNKTHSHTAADISDFDTEVSNNTDVAANTTHRGRTDNPHGVTASQVGINSTDDISEGTTNLYYTDARVSANTDVAANSTHRTTVGNPHKTLVNDLNDVDAPTPADGDVLMWDGAAGKWVSSAGGGGVTDHGALTGLGDDDHTQYVLVNGTRAFTGTLAGDLCVSGLVQGANLSTPGNIDFGGDLTTPGGMGIDTVIEIPDGGGQLHRLTFSKGVLIAYEIL